MIVIIITAIVLLNAMVMAFDLHNPNLPSSVASLIRHGRNYSSRVSIHTTSEGPNMKGRQRYFVCTRSNSFTARKNYDSTSTLFMGIGDFFRRPRQGDFVKLESTESAYGPGPVILFFNVPDGISNDELTEMIEDGVPSASKTDGGVKYQRYVSEDLSGNLADGTVSQILELALQQSPSPPQEEYNSKAPTTTSIAPMPVNDGKFDVNTPILYFSGVTNKEMMQTYNIIAREIFDETGGGIAACAKAVKPAMSKSFRQLLTEISGDHSEATAGVKKPYS